MKFKEKLVEVRLMMALYGLQIIEYNIAAV